MYLLTWVAFGPAAEYFDSREEATETYEATTRSPSTHVELFERRGNDWIRIRPEGE